MTLEVSFTESMPGFDDYSGFALREIDSAPGLYALESATPAPVRLFLADVAVFAPSYDPELPESALEALGLSSPADGKLLVVVNHSGGSTTVNLMAPLLLNEKTGSCTQIILDGRDYPLRAELKSA